MSSLYEKIQEEYESYCKYCRKHKIKEKDIVEKWRAHYNEIIKKRK